MPWIDYEPAGPWWVIVGAALVIGWPCLVPPFLIMLWALLNAAPREEK